MKIINFIKNTGAIFFIFSVFFFASIYSLPNVAKSAEPSHSGIYTCVATGKKIIDKDGKKFAEEIIDGKTVLLPLCNFTELINQINYLITVLFKIFVPIVVCVFIYAGTKMMSSVPSKRADAREMLKKVAIGFAIMCSAFIIVKLVMEGFADSSFLFLFN